MGLVVTVRYHAWIRGVHASTSVSGAVCEMIAVCLVENLWRYVRSNSMVWVGINFAYRREVVMIYWWQVMGLYAT